MSDPTSKTTAPTPHRQGYSAGYRNDPMIMPLGLHSKHWNAWSSGYLLGQQDGQNDALIDEWEAADGKA